MDVVKNKSGQPFPRPEVPISKKHKHTQELWGYIRLGPHASLLALGWQKVSDPQTTSWWSLYTYQTPNC